MKKKIASIINKLPYINKLYLQVSAFKINSCYPAGHYHSPIVSVDHIKSREKEIWKGLERDGINGVYLNTKGQLNLVRELLKYYSENPFRANKSENRRYYFENGFYLYTDGLILYSMMRHIKPKRIIEVGSGFTSALMLDVNDLFFNKKIKLTFIEPNAERLFSLMSKEDKEKSTVIQNHVQSVDLACFQQLEAGDILFIDSSHVSKTGSDVNFILFEILPLLKSGVLVHFHDIFYPFEYPIEWVLGGRNWNEDYMLAPVSK